MVEAAESEGAPPPGWTGGAVDESLFDLAGDDDLDGLDDLDSDED
jgi:hypothetical protein